MYLEISNDLLLYNKKKLNFYFIPVIKIKFLRINPSKKRYDEHRPIS